MQILKAFFGGSEGNWRIHGLKAIPLTPDGDANVVYYPVRDNVFLPDNKTVGTIRYFLGQSIVPIVARVVDENIIRCLGTGFFVSCSGILITAAHVIIDPFERKYGTVRELEEHIWHLDLVKLGVMLPTNPIFGVKGYILREIEWAAFLGEHRQSPLHAAHDDIKLTTDIAVCKVEPIEAGIPHQPLAVVQRGLKGIGMNVGKTATALGYAGMRDVELSPVRNGMVEGDFCFDLHVSRGKILERYPDNWDTREVPTPGSCFSMSNKLTPGMSGGPVYDEERIYVHGVVSKGWEDTDGPEHYGFGSMLAHSLGLPIKPLQEKSLFDLWDVESHGFVKLVIPDA